MGLDSSAKDVAQLHNAAPLPANADRQFKPFDLFGPNVDLDTIEIPSRDEPLIHIACHQHAPCPCCGHYQPHLDSISISAVGVPSERPNENTALAAYFGEWSQWNVAATLEPRYSENQASILAAILGCLQVARIRAMRMHQEFGLRHVVIKTDSSFLYDAMTSDDAFNPQSKFRTIVSDSAADATMLRLLDACVETLEANDVLVQFWLVSSGRNIDGHQLAVFERIRSGRSAYSSQTVP